MGTLRRPMLAAAILAAHLAGPRPAEARVCVTVTVFVADQPTPSGPHCQPLLDKRSEDCPRPDVQHAGYGASLELCHPVFP